MTDEHQGMFLIEKRGLYYRPDASGYTGLKRDAGRYSFEEAAERVGPNGPDGPQDGMGMWAEDEAPEYSSQCPWDLKMKDQAYQAGFADGRADAPAQNVRVKRLVEAGNIMSADTSRSHSAIWSDALAALEKNDE